VLVILPLPVRIRDAGPPQNRSWVIVYTTTRILRPILVNNPLALFGKQTVDRAAVLPIAGILRRRQEVTGVITAAKSSGEFLVIP
jgi:hypothetical protein